MFLGDFQAAGGKIKGLRRVVDAAKYNIYECFIKFDDIECTALIQEHISGMTLLGFKERDVEKKILDRVKDHCDEKAKKLMAKRDRWLMISSVLRGVAFCVFFYYGSSLLYTALSGMIGINMVYNCLGLVVGYAIKQVSKYLQLIYANVIPGNINNIERSQIMQ